MISENYDASKRVKKINVGSKERPVMVDYLEVEYRVLWSRIECPEIDLRTEMLPIVGELVVMKATAIRPDGAVATGHGSCKLNVPDAVEKAETGAVGRALGFLGYGTEAALADEGHVCDSPAERPQGKANEAAAVNMATAKAGNGEAELIPADPNQAVTWFQARVEAMAPVQMSDLAKQQVAKAVAISIKKAGIPEVARTMMYKRLTGKKSGLEMDPRELQLIAELVSSRPELMLAIAGIDPEARIKQ